MKWLLSLLLLLLLIGIPSFVSANTITVSQNGKSSQTNINVETNTGNNMVCVNGECTSTDTSSGENTVCINGECTTTGAGEDIHRESSDGSSVVDIVSHDYLSPTIGQQVFEEQEKATKKQQKIKEKKEEIKEEMVERNSFIQEIITKLKGLLQEFSFFAKN